MDDARFYYDRLYPLKDSALKIITAVSTPFYLTGGTALSRGYCHHRFSDDLDLFVNDNDDFILYCDRLFHALTSNGFKLVVMRRDDRFARATVSLGQDPLKIEPVNDVPSHIGPIVDHPVLGRLDS